MNPCVTDRLILYWHAKSGIVDNLTILQAYVSVRFGTDILLVEEKYDTIKFKMKSGKGHYLTKSWTFNRINTFHKASQENRLAGLKIEKWAAEDTMPVEFQEQQKTRCQLNFASIQG